MAKTADYTRKAIDDYRNRNDFINLRFPKGTKERVKELGISNNDLAQECLNFIASVEENMSNDNFTFQPTVQTEINHEKETSKEITKELPKDENKANTASEEDSISEVPCEENGFNDLKACDWNKEKHKGIVPYPPMGTPDNATWDSRTEEWCEPLPFEY